MKKLIFVIVILAVIFGGYYLMKQKSAETIVNKESSQTSQVSGQSQTAQTAPITSDTSVDLNNLQKENVADNFSAIDTDFGAEVNAAAQ